MQSEIRICSENWGVGQALYILEPCVKAVELHFSKTTWFKVQTHRQQHLDNLRSEPSHSSVILNHVEIADKEYY